MSLPGSRPINILWIMADELRASALGCYGDDPASPGWDAAATPNLDALARRGVRFSRHWCNSPACVPSRCSMLTARRPERTAVYSNEGAWASYPLPEILTTFPEHMARHGYATVSFGKAHLPKGYRAWQVDEPEGSGMDIFYRAADPSELQPIVPPGIPSPVGGRFPDDRPYPPEAVTRNALEWLSEASTRLPFLLRVSYLQPHTPVLPPDRYRRRYSPDGLPGHHLHGGGSRYEELFAETVGGRSLSRAEMQRAQADYLALVCWVDHQVGQLIAGLKAAGRTDDTVVVFNSDHGASLGENGLLSKVVHAPQSQRIPLILAGPGVPAGAERHDLSQALDLGRTLCGLAGIPADDEFEGRDLLRDPAPEAVYSVVGQGHRGATASSAANVGHWDGGRGWPRRACLRTERWRFDMNVRQDGEAVRPEAEDAFLADSLADPLERENLAGRPDLAGLVSGFRARLLARAAEAREPEFVPKFSAAEVGEFAPPAF